MNDLKFKRKNLIKLIKKQRRENFLLLVILVGGICYNFGFLLGYIAGVIS
ncbi:hypothetical protein LCGC14_2030770 [marine sediment metagenome]|uniref:Uncharacterized protein n=1 Tax=marine sediment metagenome TaxID=412755 RepID=A0A0F9EUZ7_9ZZZZ